MRIVYSAIGESPLDLVKGSLTPGGAAPYAQLVGVRSAQLIAGEIPPGSSRIWAVRQPIASENCARPTVNLAWFLIADAITPPTPYLAPPPRPVGGQSGTAGPQFGRSLSAEESGIPSPTHLSLPPGCA